MTITQLPHSVQIHICPFHTLDYVPGENPVYTPYQYQARCTCGWTGEHRNRHQLAEADGIGHYADIVREANFEDITNG